jgi:pimeloyl-ACP methyl ester carboxylesterase
MCGAVFERFIEAMGTDRLVLAPDTPGYGQSDPPPDPVGIENFAGAMTDLLDAEGIEAVDVMGYHTGSATTLELARQQPNRARRLVIVSALMHSQEEFSEIADFLEKQAAVPLTEQTAALSERYSFFEKFWPDMPKDETAWGLFFASNTQTYISHWGFRAAFAYDFPAALKKTTHPLMVLNPEDDVWEVTPRAAPLIQNGHIHDLPGWTHGFLHIHVDEAAAVVREFLDL